MITPRLECIIRHIRGVTVADIGSDHAYVPTRLIEEKRAGYVIATDVNEGPLNIARQNIEKNGLSDKIETRLGDGLDVIAPGEAEVIIIAGMGGEITERILRRGEETAKSARLVLQPMNSQYELRKYLIMNGYRITAEDIAVEGFKVYNIIEAEMGVQEPFENEFDYQIPPCLYEHEHFSKLMEKKRREFEKIVKGMEKAKTYDKEKYNLYSYFLKELNGI